MNHPWKILVVGLALAAAAFAMVACDATAQHDSADGTKPAPKLKLPTLDGKTFDLAKERGKVVVLNFWATWCGPCVHEIPDFIKLQEKYKNKGLLFAGVSMDDGDAPVKQFVKRKDVNYPMMMDGAKAFETYQKLLPEPQRGGIPATFIIDRKGVIRHQIVGGRDRKTFEKMILPLLEEKADTASTGM